MDLARARGPARLVDGALLDPTCIDPYYRRTVRVSMGEILFLPTARASAWPGDLDVVRAAGGRCVPVGGPEVTHAPGFVAVRAEAGEQAERAGHWLQARLTALYLRRDYGR